MPHSSKILISAAALIVSCTASDAGRPADRAGDTSLLPSFAVRVSGDSVHLEIRVANGGAGPAILEFPTSQRYDFTVLTETGDTLWQWSRDRMFAQVAGTERIDPGGELSWSAIWESGERSGVLRAGGRVVSTSQPIELETEFEVPGQ